MALKSPDFHFDEGEEEMPNKLLLQRNINSKAVQKQALG